jgi:hypothetical protein
VFALSPRVRVGGGVGEWFALSPRVRVGGALSVRSSVGVGAWCFALYRRVRVGSGVVSPLRLRFSMVVLALSPRVLSVGWVVVFASNPRVRAGGGGWCLLAILAFVLVVVGGVCSHPRVRGVGEWCLLVSPRVRVEWRCLIACACWWACLRALSLSAILCGSLLSCLCPLYRCHVCVVSLSLSCLCGLSLAVMFV